MGLLQVARFSWKNKNRTGTSMRESYVIEPAAGGTRLQKQNKWSGRASHPFASQDDQTLVQVAQNQGGI